MPIISLPNTARESAATLIEATKTADWQQEYDAKPNYQVDRSIPVRCAQTGKLLCWPVKSECADMLLELGIHLQT